MPRKQLDARLRTIVEILKALATERVHDLACDHGLVGAHYASAFPDKEVYLSDIAEQPLERAKELINLLQLKNTHCFLSNGLEKHSIHPFDAVVLAGLSGETIWRICKQDVRIAACDYRKRIPLFIVAQPMQLAAKLKLALYLHDFAILHESLVMDKGRIQEVILLVNQPYQALHLDAKLESRISNFVKAEGQKFIFSQAVTRTCLENWHKNLKVELGLANDFSEPDVQVVLKKLVQINADFVEKKEVNTSLQLLKALIVCGLTSLLTYGQSAEKEVLATSVCLPALKSKLTNLTNERWISSDMRYLANLLKYYEHKLPHLKTKLLHAPISEKVFWQSILACLGL